MNQQSLALAVVVVAMIVVAGAVLLGFGHVLAGLHLPTITGLDR